MKTTEEFLLLKTELFVKLSNIFEFLDYFWNFNFKLILSQINNSQTAKFFYLSLVTYLLIERLFIIISNYAIINFLLS